MGSTVRDSIPGGGWEIVVWSKYSRQTLTQWVQGFLPGIMLPGHEADYCLPRSAWVKMSGDLPVSSAHVHLHGVQRDNFKFAFYDFI